MIGLPSKAATRARNGFCGLPTAFVWKGFTRALQTLSNVVGSPCHFWRANMAQEARFIHFGSIVMERGFCLSCGDECYITGSGRSSCCHEATRSSNGETHHYESPIPIGAKRRRPSPEAQEEILKAQGNRCYWCGRVFGGYAIRAGKAPIPMKPVWDHYIPFSVTGLSGDHEFVASCWRCNIHKAAFVLREFSWTEKKLQNYLVKRWSNGGWKDA